ncbi:MAG: hypothetical protein ACE5FZ_07760 [Nitrospiria bacterium]
MSGKVSKKVLPVIAIAAFYLGMVFLGALCDSGKLSGHHNQKRGMHHSVSCLLACANIVTQAGEFPTLPSVLPAVGVLLLLLSLTRPQSLASILHSRGPPQTH